MAFVIVNVDVPDLCASTLWLNEMLLGLITDTHCGIGVGVGVALGVGVAVGVEGELPLLEPEEAGVPRSHRRPEARGDAPDRVGVNHERAEAL